MISVKIRFRVSSLIKREGTLYFQVIYNRKVRQISTPYRIYEWEWDRQSNDIVNQSKISSERLNIIKTIHDNIVWEKKRINKIIESLQNSSKPFSVDDIVVSYRNSLENRTSVFDYIRIRINYLKDAGRERTSETYKQMLFSFMKFRNHEDLYFDMIDDKLICQYESFMKNSNLCRNTTSFYMRILRSVYNRAVEDGLSKQMNPFRHVYTGVDKTSKRAIGLDEIRRIKNLNLSNTPKLDFARDIFLFSFYMRGMSFIDIAYLQKTNLSGGYISYNRKKTGQQMTIKWEKEMEEIANKYVSQSDTFLFPIIERNDGTERKQYLNKMLLINRRLKVIAEKIALSVPLTMYVARHSWASIAQSNNIPINAISLGMGHDKEETTRIYLASIQTDVIDNANSKILRLLSKEHL
ncbi:site-specific integrase [Coprobacter fastidiosus]|uniref:site-specific integrase n=1 Tax=Coprobacter fastidiosus TaxID=1099853 RepID=UPI000240E644|nr:site-specific integrase [Coprobacter fastidiosus]EHL87222.1 hypothetical protein HMPREF1033_01032 [Tannerella sp. 6_1_58FAA_CT1]